MNIILVLTALLHIIDTDIYLQNKMKKEGTRVVHGEWTPSKQNINAVFFEAKFFL